MDTQESKIDVLVEIGGIYGSGMNVSSYPNITIAVLSYNTMDYHARCKAEEQASEIRKGFLAPAPIDWGKEFDHMISLRQKAIQYITDAVSTCITIYLGEDGVASFDPDRGGWGGQEGVLATVMYNRYKQVILCDRYEESGDTDYEYTLDSLETSQLIEVAARVSQAIAGK